jgi:hypothetical protein
MRRHETVRLSPEEHCAIHHFIRVHGRRPAPGELAREVDTPGRGARGPSPALVLPHRLRRKVARFLGQL